MNCFKVIVFALSLSLSFKSLADECQLITENQNSSSKMDLTELLSREKENSYTFLTQNGFFSLLRKYAEAGKFQEALRFYQTWPWQTEPIEKFSPWAHVPESQKAECEYWMWKVFAQFIPQVTSRCIENPVTHLCDEGDYLEKIYSSYSKAYPQSPRLSEIYAFSQKFYSYKFKHEFDKLDLFIREYETAVRPNNPLSWVIENGLRGNGRRKDGKVYAHCVGPRPGSFGSEYTGGLNGACELVPRHSLITRILNQTQFILTFAQESDQAEVKALESKYMEELKQMLKKNPQLREEVYPTYRDLD